MKKFKVIIVTFLCLVLTYFNLNRPREPSYEHFILRNFHQNENEDANLIRLESKCPCRKEVLYVEDIRKKMFTCDLFNTIRRGKGQKVVSYSLYGSDPLYYSEIKTISKQVAKHYPGWIMRIYYDKSINQSIICDYECLKDEVTGKYTNICNINEIPFGNPVKTWDAQYMHSMKWRFLPIGDPFVDMFISRDLDSWIIEREVAAVKEWFNSNTLFHVMRGLIF